MNKDNVEQTRESILKAALPLAAFDGWGWSVIEQAAVDAGFEGSVARAVFPDRVVDVLDAFADLADKEMLAALKETDPKSLRIRERVRVALLARYRWLAPHKEALRQSVQFLMMHTRKPKGAALVWRTADRIWQWAGDDSANYSRFAKRGLLSGIIVSTTLVFLNDDTEDLERTAAFLERRIENVLQLGRIIGKMKSAS